MTDDEYMEAMKALYDEFYDMGGKLSYEPDEEMTEQDLAAHLWLRDEIIALKEAYVEAQND